MPSRPENCTRATPAALRTAHAFAFVNRGEGGIQIEVHAGGDDVEIEIPPEGGISGVFVEHRNQRTPTGQKNDAFLTRPRETFAEPDRTARGDLMSPRTIIYPRRPTLPLIRSVRMEHPDPSGALAPLPFVLAIHETSYGFRVNRTIDGVSKVKAWNRRSYERADNKLRLLISAAHRNGFLITGTWPQADQEVR